MASLTKPTVGLVAPPYIPIRRQIDGYGGTERVVAELAIALIRRGNEVTLVAPEGSDIPGARIVSTGKALWSNNYTLTDRDDREATEATLSAAHVVSRFTDLIHFHIDEGLADNRFEGKPCVITLHDGKSVFNAVRQHSYKVRNGRSIVPISEDQRLMLMNMLPAGVQISVVYNGLDPNNFEYSETVGNHLLFVGRVAPEKALHLALDAAYCSKTRIVVIYRMPLNNESDQCAQNDWMYYKEEIEPRLKLYARFVHLIEDPPRPVIIRYMSSALATIGLSGAPPSSWREPFGLFAIESMASGTPVIAYKKGGPAEIIQHGVSGFLVEAADERGARAETVEYIRRVREAGPSMRIDARSRVVDKFTAERMAEQYERVYKRAMRKG